MKNSICAGVDLIELSILKMQCELKGYLSSLTNQHNWAINTRYSETWRTCQGDEDAVADYLDMEKNCRFLLGKRTEVKWDMRWN